MPVQRLKHLLIWSSIFVFSLPILATTYSHEDSTLFYERLRSFYRDRISTFNSELSIQEAFLVGQFNGIKRELKKRKVKALPPEFFSSDMDSLIEAVPLSLKEINQINLPGKVDVWISKQRRLIQGKEMKARQMKDMLLADASPQDIKRMFDFGMELAAWSYANGNFDLAIAQFSEILNCYSSPHMDDMIIYLAESYYGKQMYGHARSLYLKLLEEYPDSDYRSWILDHLMHTWLIYRDYLAVANFHRLHGNGYFEIAGERRDEILFMVGLAYFNIEQYDQASSLLKLIDDNSDYMLRKYHLIASCNIFLDNGELAITQLENLGTMKIKKLKEYRKEYIRDDANVKLGYLYFERGQYKVAQEAFNRVDELSPYYDDTILGHAWA